MRVAFGIPAYGSRVSCGHLLQAAQMSWAWCKNGLPSPFMLTVDTASVDKARNLLIAKARDAKADWLLMCDADTYHVMPPPVFAMLSEGQRRGAAVIGAPVKMRKRPGYNVAGADYKLVPEEQWRGRVLEVERIGTAFTAVNLGWLVKNWPSSPWFMFEHLPGPNPETVGEDYWFCRGVRDRGGLILADGRFEPTHVGASDEFGMLQQVGVETFHTDGEATVPGAVIEYATGTGG